VFKQPLIVNAGPSKPPLQLLLMTLSVFWLVTPVLTIKVAYAVAVVIDTAMVKAAIAATCFQIPMGSALGN
jgi:hypothetical protein